MPANPLPFEPHDDLLPIVEVLERHVISDKRVLPALWSGWPAACLGIGPVAPTIASSATAAEHRGKEVIC